MSESIHIVEEGRQMMQKVLQRRIEEVLEKAEKAQRDWAESCRLLEDLIVVYGAELGAPLPDELSSRVALLGYKRKRKQRSKGER